MKSRKLLVVLTATLIAVLAVVLFAACDGHKHIYSEDWSYDDQYHWHQAICGHDDATSGKAQHSLDADGDCSVCGYSQSAKGLSYELNADGASWRVVGMEKLNAQSVEIPAYYKDKPVTSVGQDAFSNKRINYLTVPSTVTEIAQSAFSACDLEKVTFEGDSQLQTIGEFAFSSNKFTEITIPATVTSIGDCAFMFTPIQKVYYNGTVDKWCNIEFGDWEANPMAANNQGYDKMGDSHFYVKQNGAWTELTEIEIPQGTTKVGDYVFFGFNNVTSVVIPDSVTEIGEIFFANDNLKSLTLPFVGNGTNSTEFCCIFSGGDNPNTLNVDVTGGTSIADNAFIGQKLNVVTLPDGLVDIGDYAFSGSSVKEITIPQSVKNIGTGAFDSRALHSIYYRGTIQDWCDIEFADRNANPMAHEYNFTEYKPKFYLQNNGDWDAITTLQVPEGVQQLHSYAFCGFDQLTSATLPDSLTAIGELALGKCLHLQSLTMPLVQNEMFDTNYLSYILGIEQDSTYYEGIVGYSLETLVLTSGTSIPDFAFALCINLRSVTLPDTIQSIGNYAFSNCRCLSEITLPENVSRIGNYAFTECDSLAEITIPENIEYIGECAFDKCDVATVYLEAAQIPEQSEEEGGWGYDWDGSAKVVLDCRNNDVATDGNIYKIIDGIRYALKGDQATVLYNHYTDEVTIPSVVQYKGQNYTVTAIDNRAFLEQNTADFYARFNLTSVVIPSTVTTIGVYAFSGCDQLATVTFESGSQLQNIDGSAFDIDARRNSLQSVYFGGTLENWCKIDFSNQESNPMMAAEHFYLLNGNSWEQLTELVIPENVTQLGRYVFYGFDDLQTITVHENVTSVGDGAFGACKLQTVYWNAIDCKAPFENISLISAVFSSVTDAYIGENVETLPGCLFYKCGNLQTVTFTGDKLQSIGGYDFYECKNLTEVTIPSSVTVINSQAFVGCENLASVTFENETGWSTYGESLTLSDPITNAQYLTTTYTEYPWKRSE